MKSGLEFSGIDMKWATVYVALSSEQEDINRWRMCDLIPRRRHTQGGRPKIGACKVKDAEEKWIWMKQPDSYTKEERLKVIAKMIQIMVQTTFKSHFYQWGGAIYKQEKGGPIGLRASGTVAKCAMEDSINKFEKLL